MSKSLYDLPLYGVGYFSSLSEFLRYDTERFTHSDDFILERHVVTSNNNGSRNQPIIIAPDNNNSNSLSQAKKRGRPEDEVDFGQSKRNKKGDKGSTISDGSIDQLLLDAVANDYAASQSIRGEKGK